MKILTIDPREVAQMKLELSKHASSGRLSLNMPAYILLKSKYKKVAKTGGVKIVDSAN